MHRAGGWAGFWRGFLCAILVVFGGRLFINRTSFADRAIAPLLTQDTSAAADAIVILGAGVVGDCIPNNNAVRRVLLAAELWHQQRAPLVLNVGGSGEASCPVSVAAQNLARELGIPQSSLRLETVSRSTRENGELSAPLLRGWGVQRVLLVTDRLHMRRASGVFRRLGFDVEQASVPIYEGHEDNVSMLRAGLREYAALAYYRFRGWTGAADGPAVPKTTPSTQMNHPTSKNVGPIVLLGASYAQGWRMSSVGSVPVINRGIAGQQSFELLQRFESDVVPAEPRAVILWGFINDIFRAPPNGIEQAQARIRDSYTQMIAAARARGIEPILATEVTARPGNGSFMDTVASFIGTLRGKPSYQDQINTHVLANNQWLIELGAREGILVLQLQSVLAEPGGRRRKQFAQPDGSHITASGYDMLTAYATPILEEFLVAR